MSKDQTGIKTSGLHAGFLARYWLAFMFIVLLVVFGVLEPSFFKTTNLLNIFSSACLTAIAGIGMTCIMSSGEMDFAAGTELSLGAASMAWIMTETPIKNYFIALFITFCLLAFFGLLNAFLHVKVGIPAFIATLGTSYIFRGLIKGFVSVGSINGVEKGGRKIFTFLGQKYVAGIIPMPVVVLLIISVVMMIYTERTRSGRFLYAVGSNKAACKYIGIDADKEKIKGFLLCAFFCGFAGIVQGSMLNGCTATMGDAMLTQGLTVLMLGASFFKLGVYNIPGTIVASLLLSMISNGMTMTNVSNSGRDFIQAVILLFAVTLVTWLRRRINK